MIPSPDAQADDRLHTLARKLFEAERLPDEDPIKETVGLSSGATCALCHGAILEPHAECTLEFAESEPTGQPRTLHFHVFCRDLWRAERHRRHREPSWDGGTPTSSHAPHERTSCTQRSTKP